MNQLILGDCLEVLRDKTGTHTIAVKAVDSEGLEAIEIIKNKVNGVVKRE